MKKIIRLLLMLLLCYQANAIAQSDSMYLDLGRIRIRKDFTQTITVKGSDLQRMPFANLTEAINVWMMGTYTAKKTVLYIVDGNLLNDVNAYSIYDIEEVTLVQNAMIQVSGATRQQQLVVVTTKKHAGEKAGICAAGQIFGTGKELYNTSATNYKSTVNLYHQYHLQAWQNRQRMQYGISVNYLRDVNPQTKQENLVKFTPIQHFDRFRIHAYLNAQLGNNNTLQLNVGYAPQKLADGRTSVSMGSNDKYTYTNRQSLFMPSLQLHSRFSKNWNNDLSVAYVPGVGRMKTEQVYGTYFFEGRSKNQIRQLLVRDHLSYSQQLGSWQLEPSLDIMYRNVTIKSETSSVTSQNGMPVSGVYFTTDQDGDLFLLTPSVNLLYRNIFNVQAGWLQNLSDDNGRKMKGAFPFASASFDLIKAFRPGARAGLKLFGSYAKAGDFADIQYALNDFIPEPSFLPAGTSYIVMPAADTAWQIMTTGAVFNGWNNRLTINYYFERRHFNAEFGEYIPTPFPTPSWNYRVHMPEFRSYTHRLGCQVKIMEQPHVQWLSGINITRIKSKTHESYSLAFPNITGNYESARTTWTGGWINRFGYKGLIVGCDVLYYLNAEKYNLPSATPEKSNPWLLQNLYAGYQWQQGKLKGMEVYAASRNLAQNDKYDLSDGRRFYGVGFKMCLNQN